MGYYTGNGQTVGGGVTVLLRSTGPDSAGAWYVYQRVTSVVTQKNGVSLATAQATTGDINMNYWTWPRGMVEPGCRGTRSMTSYSQINGSNLYQLQVTNETVQVRGKQGTYDSGWVS